MSKDNEIRLIATAKIMLEVRKKIRADGTCPDINLF